MRRSRGLGRAYSSGAVSPARTRALSTAPAPETPPLPPKPPAHQRVAANTAIRAAADILGKVATLLLTVVMVRELGDGAVGDYAFAFAITQLYWPIAGFGLDRLMLREIALDDAAIARFVPQLNAIKLGVGLFTTAIGTLAVYAYKGDDEVTWVTLVLGLALVVTLLGTTAQSVFMAKERNQDFFIAALPVKVVGAVLGVIVVLAGGGLLAVAFTGLIAALAGLAIGWWILLRRYGVPPTALGGNPRTWWPLALQSWPWGLQEVFGQITFRAGIIVLYLFAGKAITGQYRLAYQLMEASLFLPWSIGSSVLPIIARGKRGERIGGEPTLEATTRGSIELVIALMMPVAVLLALCADPLLTLLFGDQGHAAADVMPYLAAATVVYGIGHIAGIVALSHLPGRRTVELTALAAVFSLTVLFLLVPPFDAKGAAIAALLTELALAALSLRLASMVTGATILTGVASIGLIAGAAMALVILPVRDNLWLSVIIGGAVYLVVLGALEYRRRGVAWDLARSLVPGAK